jgi:hypothetical protein
VAVNIQEQQVLFQVKVIQVAQDPVPIVTVVEEEEAPGPPGRRQ